jgi:sec-independent protein translocase protein TatA
MFGIGMPEMVIIMVIALVVIGPHKLPELARALGKGFAEFKKAADDLQQSLKADQAEQVRKVNQEAAEKAAAGAVATQPAPGNVDRPKEQATA